MGVVSVWHTGGRNKSHSFQSRVRLRGDMIHNHSCEVSCFFLPALQTWTGDTHVRLGKASGVRCVCVYCVCERRVFVYSRLYESGNFDFLLQKVIVGLTDLK